MTAMRVLIAWIYVNTKSVLLAQLLHASSTGSLVILSPPRVTAGQETLWYAVYACALWAVVAIVVSFNDLELRFITPQVLNVHARMTYPTSSKT